MRKFFLLFLLPVISILAQEFPIANSPYAEASEEIQKRNSFKRERWFYEQRMYPDNYIPENAYAEAGRQRDELRSSRGFYYDNFKANGESIVFEPWTNIGPTPGAYPGYSSISSRITTIQYDPLNPDIIYLGAAYGGVWKSTDGGNTWTAKSDDEASLSSGAIAIDADNTDIIYYGTGEATYSGASYYGRGLLKSTDAGETWTNITGGLPSSTYFSRIVIDPSNSNILLAALGNAGLYKSVDAGSNWTNILAGRCDDVVYTPTGDTVYAVGSGVGFQISTNGGLSFNSSSALTMGSRNHIAICRNFPNILYFAKYDGSVKVYKSTNAGSSFTQLVSSYNFNGGQAWYDFYMHVNPFDPNYAYVGTIDIYRTTNGGTSFSNITYGYSGGNVHVDQHNLAFHPTDANKMMCVNDGGVWRSSNKGTSWVNLNSTLTLTQFYRIASDPSNGKHVMGGTQDNGTQRTLGTENWSAAFGGDGGEVCFHPVNPNYILGETQNNGLQRSSNGGENWYSATNGISGSGAWVGPIIAHPTDAGIFYTARQQVFKSTSWGSSWSGISSGTSGTITQLAISKSSPNIIYASAGAEIYKSTNGGVNFGSVRNGLPNSTITSISVHPDTSSTVFVTYSGFNAQKIYKSTNSGLTWNDITGNLPNSPANDALIFPQSIGSPTLYFIAMDIGVFVTEDYGKTWVELAGGLPNTVAMHLDYNALSNEIFIGTHGRGVFKIPAPNAILNSQVEIDEGWNMVSVPLQADDMSVLGLFPGAVSDAFEYNGTYNTVTTMQNGKGYWLKYPSGENLPVSGTAVNTNITVGTGWNMIGPHHQTVTIDKITTDPAGIIESDFFGYNGVYFSASQLDYGKGYWVKTSSGGEIILGSQKNLSKKSERTDLSSVNSLIEIKIEVEDGVSDTKIPLTAGLDPAATDGLDRSLGEFDLPPPPPGGLDARFLFPVYAVEFSAFKDFRPGQTGNISEELFILRYQLGIESEGIILNLNIPKGVTLEVRDPIDGSLISDPFTEGSWVFTDPLTKAFSNLHLIMLYDGSLTDSEQPEPLQLLPDEFVLEQNYPNPFNPVTTIKYALPVESFVNLEIYNTLGQKVVTLQNTTQSAGYYTAEFDASALSSGIYLYKLTAEPVNTGKKFTGAGKMLLLK